MQNEKGQDGIVFWCAWLPPTLADVAWIIVAAAASGAR